MSVRALFGFAVAVLLAASAPALAQAPGGGSVTQQVRHQISIPLPSLAPLVERVSPAVVNVSAELNEQAAEAEQDSDVTGGNGDQTFPQSPFDQMLRRFFQNQRHPNEKVIALGSGFIIDPQGDIVTNNHVVGNAEKVTVILQDGSRHAAKIVGRDPKTDIAVLKIDVGHKLPFVEWGNSAAAKVGDWVVAVGNPFGLGGTVTAGIVSAIGRNIDEGPYDNFLQIDAPINRGNSGGPTFNLNGEVIGINTAIYTPSGGSVGIGFAIPSNLARRIVGQIEKTGHVSRGWLGVEIQDVTPAIAKNLDIGRPEGALVASVMPGSPAAKAGIKPGDVIVKAGGKTIADAHDLPVVVAEAPVGKTLPITVMRDGKQVPLSPVVAEMTSQQTEAPTANQQPQPNAGGAAALGLRLATLDPILRARLHIPKQVAGVVVTEVAAASPIGALGVQAGDVIVSVDQKPATTPQAAAALLREAAKGGNVLLLINRQGTSEFVGLSVHPGKQPG